MILGRAKFDSKTRIWVSSVGALGAINIEQPIFYVITGSTFVLSGVLLVGFHNLTESLNQNTIENIREWRNNLKEKNYSDGTYKEDGVIV